MLIRFMAQVVYAANAFLKVVLLWCVRACSIRGDVAPGCPAVMVYDSNRAYPAYIVTYKA